MKHTGDRLLTRTRRGWTRVDLTIGVFLLVLVAGAGLPALARWREAARREQCADHLRQIALAALRYADNEVRTGAFPRCIFRWQEVWQKRAPAPTAYTNWQATDPFADDGPGPHDVTASLFLLVRTQQVPTRLFICPGADVGEPWDFAGRGRTAVSNFPGRRYLSYSYACPFPSETAIQNGWKFNNSLGGDYPLLADMNPGGPGPTAVGYDAPKPVMAAANSPNHRRDGQNVAYCDGHIEFQPTPFCGPQRIAGGGVVLGYRDNLYTVGQGSVVNSSGTMSGTTSLPVDATDMVLLPEYGDGPQPPRPWLAEPSGQYAVGIVGVVVVGSIIASIALRRRLAAEHT